MTHRYVVLHGGTVLTIDGARPSDAATRALGGADARDAAGRRATAICYAHDRILAVGTDAEIVALAGPDTLAVDLRGRCVIPGFVDAHAHPLWEGLAAARPSLIGTPDLASALRALAGHGSRLEPDAWLVARYDHGAWPEVRHPTRGELDLAVPDRPVLLAHRSGHAVAANSLALALAGIDPPGLPAGRQDAGHAGRQDAGQDARVERDRDGIPTGVVTGSDAWGSFAAALPPVGRDQAADALRRAGQAMSADGVTAVTDADLGASAAPEAELAAYVAAISGGALPQRISVLPGLVRLAPAADSPLPAPADWASAIPEAVRGRLGVAGTKLYADGALTTRDAWLVAPYADDPASAGHPAADPAELAERTRRAATAGWVVATHAIGDAAIDAALAAYAIAPRPPGASHRLEHAMLLSPAQVALAARVGVAAVVQPEFVAWAGDMYRARLGDARASRILPFADLLAAGVPLAFSSDRPVVTGAPLAGIRASIRFAGPSGRRLSDARPPSAAEALHAWTATGAILAGAVDEAGRLAPGYRADLVVLSADPTAVPADAWVEGEDAVEVAATVIAGRVVFGAL